MNLTPKEIDAIAEAIVRKQIRFETPVLNTDEAMAMAGKNSTSAFLRWADKWNVTQCDRGRWPRRNLVAGMNREKRNRYSKDKEPKSTT